ncbi:DUF2087 domain-containing protein [Yoonia vestfoldensis]|uniref:DUF2087 domain-containing protein n=1 Tax=Yoonia vestfoldensis TaxID=245188 RepID=UPI000366A3CE|nr:DUF2087 domain-containing protein [Yoonia vestfoldensis]
MPRDIHAITIADLSAFTKSLRAALLRADAIPGHAAMLGLVAQAAGYANFQHLKAAPTPTAAKPSRRLARALRSFDGGGIMTRWPQQTAVQGLCLWAFWARLPARQDLTEKEVNAVLKAGHSFGDHVLLRRSLIDHKLATRTIDGKTYRRIEQAPPPEALMLLSALQRPS